MDAPSPARLYASLAGALLLVFGIVGFFYSASFGSPGEVEKELGLFGVNGWSNALHVLAGSLGLFVAGWASRAYSLCAGAFFLALACWGLYLGADAAILGFLPAPTATSLLWLALGALGIAAALATPHPGRRA